MCCAAVCHAARWCISSCTARYGPGSIRPGMRWSAAQGRLRNLCCTAGLKHRTVGVASRRLTNDIDKCNNHHRRERTDLSGIPDVYCCKHLFTKTGLVLNGAIRFSTQMKHYLMPQGEVSRFRAQGQNPRTTRLYIIYIL